MSVHFLSLKSEQKGFTLIEVMVTLVIVSVGMLSLAGLLITGIKVNADNESRMDAASLAQGIMSRVTADSTAYTSATATTYAENVLGDRFTGSASPVGVLYTPTVVLTTTGNFTFIVVKLQWTSRGSNHKVELRSGVAN